MTKDALVDSVIRIGPTSNVVVSKIGNPIYQKSSTKLDMVGGGLVSHFGVVEDIVI